MNALAATLLISLMAATPNTVPTAQEPTSTGVARVGGILLSSAGALGVTVVGVSSVSLLAPWLVPGLPGASTVRDLEHHPLFTAGALPVLLGAGVAAVAVLGAGALLGVGLMRWGPGESKPAAAPVAARPAARAKGVVNARRGQAEQRLGM
jgi:hypothetical protein